MSEAPVPEISVEPDHFDVVTNDVVLVARLESTFALCLYDAVLESGALIHLRVAPPGRVQDPNLTDTTLSTDLLLLDRCFIELRKSEPRAQHWQAKVVGQVQDLPGARERFDGIQSFLIGVPRRRQREAGFLRYARGPRAIAAISSRNGSCSQRAPCRSAPR